MEICRGMNAFLIIFMTEYIVHLLGNDDLSYGKRSAQSSTFGCVPESKCVASNAVDRDKRTCMKTHFIDQSLPLKTVWWYVDLGGVYSVHSIIIQFKSYGQMYENMQRGHFAGFSLYLSNTTKKEDGHLCYKDGPLLPPLDFTTICKGHASHVIFYNERLDGVIYPKGYEPVISTELCEVIVKDHQTMTDFRDCGAMVFALEIGIASSISLNITLVVIVIIFKRKGLFIKWKSQGIQSTKYVSSEEMSPTGVYDSQHYQEINLTELNNTYRNLELASL